MRVQTQTASVQGSVISDPGSRGQGSLNVISFSLNMTPAISCLEWHLLQNKKILHESVLMTSHSRVLLCQPPVSGSNSQHPVTLMRLSGSSSTATHSQRQQRQQCWQGSALAGMGLEPWSLIRHTSNVVQHNVRQTLLQAGKNRQNTR